jgi:uncharacterized protein (DUF433 family)
MVDRPISGTAGAAPLPALPALPGCIEQTADGAIRVAGHRVSLYLILEAFFASIPVDAIQSMYPTIPAEKLAAVLAFCDERADAIRQFYESERAAGRPAQLARNCRRRRAA